MELGRIACASSHAFGVTLLEGQRPAPRGNFVPAPQAKRSGFAGVTLLKGEACSSRLKAAPRAERSLSEALLEAVSELGMRAV